MELAYFVAALFASFLPARHWSRLPSLPISRAAPLAGVMAFLAAALLGIVGFLTYTDDVIRNTGALQIAIAERQVKGELPETTAVSAGPMAVALLSPLAFLLFTPAGQLSAYFGATALIRTVAWIADDPMGDPVLTMIDAVAARGTERFSTGHQRRVRERMEGVEVPDRLYPGSWARIKDVDFVIVSSRRKPEWTKGATVITKDAWFSLGEPFELHTIDGLRTIYPLTRHRDGDVVRRSVEYQLPPLRRA
ncbi:MAG TPA: hypothetical protein VMO26_07815 [Vicinamibacterales bacterium]|nr:hypothetical protein [Vicinamibacterales bacterium]